MLAFLANAALYVVPFLVIITFIVTIHELGHFLVARAFGVAVDRFSIGFGRTIVAIKDRWGVEWRIAWLPLGGYVKFAGDENVASVPDEDDLEALRARIIAREGPGAEKRYFAFKPLWQRALVVVAGPAANFVLSIALFAVLVRTLGEPDHPRSDSQVQPGGAAAQAGFLAATRSSPPTGTSCAVSRGHAQALSHAEGEAAGPRARNLRQPGQLDHFVHPAASEAGRPGQRQQVVAGRQARVDGPRVQQDAELRHRGGRPGVVLAVDAHRPGGRPVQAGDHPHGGGFARSVRTEETGHHARLHHEAQPVYGGLVPVPFGQAVNLDHVAPLSSVCADERDATHRAARGHLSPDHTFPAAYARGHRPRSRQRRRRAASYGSGGEGARHA